MVTTRSTLAHAVTRIVLLALVLVSVEVVASAKPSTAVVGGEFTPGNIISDALFYDSAAMTQAEIQSFLDAKIGTCLNGSCLNVLVTTFASRTRVVSARTGNVICEPIEGGTVSAAAVIYRTQVACGISAKAILVTLQKENGLVTSKAPTQRNLDAAMGMGCPDTGPCASQYQGFANQVISGSGQLVAYRASRIQKQPGWNTIAFNPNSACGSTPVYIENYATAALYSYTPYQPNAAALANLSGSGDSCSAYGNRNFWVFYNNWFGSSTGRPSYLSDFGTHVIAVPATGDALMYPGTRTGTWLPTLSLGSSLSGLTKVFGAGDFDGDGHRDILGVDASGVLQSFPTDGRNVIGTPTAVSSGWGEYLYVLNAGDFNSDGTQDIFSIDTAGVLTLYPNDGRGHLGAGLAIGSGWQNMTAVISPGDFSGDGNPDLLARDATGGLWLYTGNGRTSWLGGAKIGSGWGGMTAIIGPGDFNGDYAVDVLGRDANGGLWLYTGNGRGSWLSASKIGNGWSQSDMIAGPGATAVGPWLGQPGAGDLNGDGTRDVLARDASGSLVKFAGNGRGSWAAGSGPIGPGWAGFSTLITAGDLYDDGGSDLIGIDAAGALWIMKSNPAGGYEAPVQAGSGWSGMTAVLSPGDFDGDRKPDLLARDASGVLWLYPGAGNGSWLARKQVGSGWTSFTAILAAGDFNGDKTQDVIARGADGTLYLYGGNGFGSWVPTKAIGWGWQGMTWLTSPGDFNGDKKVDVLARDAKGGLWLYRGNGSGSWLGGGQIGQGWEGMTWIG